MNKLLFIVSLLSSFYIKAQSIVPQGINYQAVIRNNAGAIATNSTVSLKFDLFNSSALSPLAYSETHTNLNTGAMGIVTCTIGMGIPSTGNLFSNVIWPSGDVWYQVSLKLGASTIFTPIGGAQKFMTVPYAFYAGMAPTTLSVSSATGGTNLYSVGGNSVFIAASTSTGSGISSSTITGSGLAIVSPTSGSVFSVNVPAPTLSFTPSTSLLTINQGTYVSTPAIITPTLNFNTGTGILYSGIPSNSVSLSVSTSSLWSNLVANIYPTNVSGNVGIGTTVFDHKLKVVENTNTIGSAIYGLSNSTSSLSAGIYGINTGAGSSIYGYKTSGTGGSAGYFKKDISSFPDPALYAETNGSGAAIFGKSTNANNPLALHVDGHIKTNNGITPTGLSATISSSVLSVNGTTATASISTGAAISSDVAGTVTVTIGKTTSTSTNSITLNQTDYVTVKVQFAKGYTTRPKIMLSPLITTGLDVYATQLKNITPSYFDVKVIFALDISAGLSGYMNTASTGFAFQYFVVE